VRLIGGELSYQGNPVVINPPGPDWLAAQRAKQSEFDAIEVLGWATWTEEEAATWYEVNVTDLIDAIPDIDSLTPTAFQTNAQAIVAQMQTIIATQAATIRNLARLAIALRNNAWPNLEGG